MQTVADVFVGSKKFVVIDRSALSQIQAEKELQKTEDFIDGQVVAQGKSLGAQYILTGQVTDASIDNIVESGGQVSNNVSGKLFSNPFKNAFKPSPSYIGASNNQVSASVASYAAKITFSLRIHNVETWEVMTSADITTTAGTTNPLAAPFASLFASDTKSPSDALTGAIQNIKPKVIDFLRQNFPMMVSIVELDDMSTNGAVNKLLIAGGSDEGLKK